MLMACKVARCAELARAALAAGMAVVVGLQSTGEANMDQVRQEAGGQEGKRGRGGADASPLTWSYLVADGGWCLEGASRPGSSKHT